MSTYFRRVREVCDRHGVLLIADEVMCGMGRSGTLYAVEQEGVTPDLITIAKGLGGGYQPIGAVMAQERIVRAIEQGSGFFQHGHTYLGHATACAAALAVQQVIRRDGLLERVRAQGAGLRQRRNARSAIIRMWAISAAGACSWAWSWSPTAPASRPSIPRCRCMPASSARPWRAA